MRAIILAAGRGMRLQRPGEPPLPKCLLSFGGATLLERHLRLLRGVGVEEVALVLGFEHQRIRDELDRLDWSPRPQIIMNPQFELGSVLTVHRAAEPMIRGGEVLLMDADVLYDARMLAALVDGDPSASRLLIDRDFAAGEEPVKVCIRDGAPVELRKRLEPGLRYDAIGESVGFFRFDSRAARRFAEIVADYADGGRAHMPHEEAVRDLLLERSQRFETADVTGLPWVEIDFPEDVARAASRILPLLQPLPEASR